jgi:hypothetical protein
MVLGVRARGRTGVHQTGEPSRSGARADRTRIRPGPGKVGNHVHSYAPGRFRHRRADRAVRVRRGPSADPFGGLGIRLRLCSVDRRRSGMAAARVSASARAKPARGRDGRMATARGRSAGRGQRGRGYAGPVGPGIVADGFRGRVRVASTGPVRLLRRAGPAAGRIRTGPADSDSQPGRVASHLRARAGRRADRTLIRPRPVRAGSRDGRRAGGSADDLPAIRQELLVRIAGRADRGGRSARGPSAHIPVAGMAGRIAGGSAPGRSWGGPPRASCGPARAGRIAGRGAPRRAAGGGPPAPGAPAPPISTFL